MTEFLIGAAFVALISTLVGLFVWYHDRKQEKELKSPGGNK